MRHGGARISPFHAAFIENIGNASSADVIALIETVRERALNELGLNLKLEVEIIGTFNKD